MTQTDLLIKPLFANCFGVRDKWVKMALKNPPLRVRTSMGSNDFDPRWIMKNCETIKKEFKIVGVPMILYKVFITPKKKETEEERLKYLCSIGAL